MAWSKGHIVERHDWAKGLVSLRLEADVDAFEPGQFLNVGLRFEGELVFRAYSLASPPGGLLEFYATRRVGIRFSVIPIRNGYDRPDDDDERQLRFGGDVIYNWEGGRIHPFVGGGIGVHLLRFYRDGDNQGDNDTKIGGQALGGLEYFLNRAWTLKGEGRYQWVEDRPTLNPDGLSLTIGIKRYF